MPHPVDIYVGKRLRLRRKEIGMSQVELGDKLEITFQQIQKYEKGTNRIGASRLFALSSALGVHVSYFFEGLQSIDDRAHREEESSLSVQLMRLIRAFNQIDNPKVLDNTIHLIEGIADIKCLKSGKRSSNLPGFTPTAADAD